MREVDRRSKYDRRVFLKGAATAVPAAAIATSVGLTVSDAWADEATTLTPATLKTLVKVARDIYPHDFLGDSYYITAIKPWDGKAAKDPATKSLINDGVARLDQEANARHKVPYAQVQWETDRVALLQGIEQTAFFQKVRGDLVVSLYNQKEVWPKFGYEGSSAEHALKEGLAREGRRTAANTDGAALSAFRPSFAPRPSNWDWRSSPAYPVNSAPSFGGSVASALAEAGQAAFDVGTPTADVRFEAQPSADLLDRPLGAARTQIHETYIVSQTRDGLIVVDQHAAHERIVYEKLKASLAKNGVQRQILLIPEIVELDEATVEKLLDRAEELASFGLAIDSFGPGAVAVRETPSLLGKANAAGLLRDLAEHMSDQP